MIPILQFSMEKPDRIADILADTGNHEAAVDAGLRTPGGERLMDEVMGEEEAERFGGMG